MTMLECRALVETLANSKSQRITQNCSLPTRWTASRSDTFRSVGQAHNSRTQVETITIRARMRRTKPSLYDRTQPRRLANKTTLLATVLLSALLRLARIGKLVLMVSSHSLPSFKALPHQGSLSWPRAPVRGVLKVTTRTNCQHLAVTSSVTMDKQ